MSDALGRRMSGFLIGMGGAISMALAGSWHDVYLGTVSMFFVRIMIRRFFGDASYAIIGPYLAEVWPNRLRASGMGFAYGIGNLGKIIGPLRLALIAGGPCLRLPRDRDEGPLDRGDRPRARCAGSAGARQGGGNANLIRRAAGRLPALRRIGPVARSSRLSAIRPSARDT
jgi:hypothetical protein